MKKYFGVEHVFTNKVKRFTSLKKAIEFVLDSDEPRYYLPFVNNINLDYYQYGDTFETYYNRCYDIVKSIEKSYEMRHHL